MPLFGFLGFAANNWVASLIFAWLLQVGGGSLLIVVVFHAWFDIVTSSPLGPPALPMMMGGCHHGARPHPVVEHAIPAAGTP